LQGESEITLYLPSNPRNAKRLYNQLYVVIAAAQQRRMFGGQPKLEARHVVKWVVLLELWPELASMLTVGSRLLADLESADSIAALSQRLDSAGLTSLASQDLLLFLRSRTKLAPVVERLFYLQPFGTDQSVEVGTHRYWCADLARLQELTIQAEA
jgi:hypothetical protein